MAFRVGEEGDRKVGENEQREKRGGRNKRKRAKWSKEKRRGKGKEREGIEAKMMCSEQKKTPPTALSAPTPTL